MSWRERAGRRGDENRQFRQRKKSDKKTYAAQTRSGGSQSRPPTGRRCRIGKRSCRRRGRCAKEEEGGQSTLLPLLAGLLRTLLWEVERERTPSGSLLARSASRRPPTPSPPPKRAKQRQENAPNKLGFLVGDGLPIGCGGRGLSDF
jgi:hypothetical protein